MLHKTFLIHTNFWYSLAIDVSNKATINIESTEPNLKGGTRSCLDIELRPQNRIFNHWIELVWFKLRRISIFKSWYILILCKIVCKWWAQNAEVDRLYVPYNTFYFLILAYLTTQKNCKMDKWLYFGFCIFKKG